MKPVKFLFIILLLTAGKNVFAQQNGRDSVMITIFLKHQQDKNLDALETIQKKNKFGEMFPPKGSRVISWYVMMGIGQVVTVKIQAADLRKLNMAIENGAWGAFNTEFYPTYDYKPIWESSQDK